MFRSYSNLIKLNTFKERFLYLKLNSNIGISTFGSCRFLNQEFYRSDEWKNVRKSIIVRDFGCDLGVDGREIFGPIVVHHINPITAFDIEHSTSKLFDPENLITISPVTHKAVHYGNDDILIIEPAERYKNDTCPWLSKEVIQ